jgi:hypothetical protein
MINEVPPRTTTAAELDRVSFLRVWARIPVAFINHLIHSMYSRWFATIKVNGGHTRYWLSFLISFKSVLMYCWQTSPKIIF